jgi:ComF family protein
MPCTGFYQHLTNPVEKIFRGRIPLVSATAHVYFTKQSAVQRLLHRLKYKGDKNAGEYMGRMMGSKLKTCKWLGDVDGLIPLPLNIKKERRRGYNQAEIICSGISGEMNVPIFNNIVRRSRYSETQTHKSRMERWSNIENKFELTGTEISNRHFLLVDDVVTTGATLESCGKELLKQQGVKLSIATFAYTSL